MYMFTKLYRNTLLVPATKCLLNINSISPYNLVTSIIIISTSQVRKPRQSSAVTSPRPPAGT